MKSSSRIIRKHVFRARLVFDLRSQGLNNPQIANKLNWSINEVNMVIHRARQNGVWDALMLEALSASGSTCQHPKNMNSAAVRALHGVHGTTR